MKGFTLIELLVVVVIVGILSSIALPQYTKAVEKSRAVEAITLGRSIMEAQRRYLTAFPGADVSYKNTLDIQLTGGTWNAEKTQYETENFTYFLMGASGSPGVEIKRNGANSYTIGLTDTGAFCSGHAVCKTLSGWGVKSS